MFERAGAVLTVDLDAIAWNYRLLRDKLGGVACAAVVKANAYGLGAVAVSQRLLDEGCDTFFVATLDEGLDLRKALGRVPAIFVLNGVPTSGEGDAVQRNLTPVLNSLDSLARWRQVAALRDVQLPAAIQFDSGMARLGLAENDVAVLVSNRSLTLGIRTVLLMSHLACADEPSHPANFSQLKSFERMRAKLPTIPASLCNSSGIFLGNRFHFDLARPGAALYGINPTADQSNPVRGVVNLSARIIQVRSVESGAPVGYGQVSSARRRSKLATIFLGYADGWLRNAIADAFYLGQRLPFIGRISMDSIVIDVTDCFHTPCEGDLVELIGSDQTADDVAATAGTIGYEILSSLGGRVARRYLDETRSGVRVKANLASKSRTCAATD